MKERFLGVGVLMLDHAVHESWAARSSLKDVAIRKYFDTGISPPASLVSDHEKKPLKEI